MIAVARTPHGRIVHVLPTDATARPARTTACGVRIADTWLVWTTATPSDGTVSCARCRATLDPTTP